MGKAFLCPKISRRFSVIMKILMINLITINLKFIQIQNKQNNKWITISQMKNKTTLITLQGFWNLSFRKIMNLKEVEQTMVKKDISIHIKIINFRVPYRKYLLNRHSLKLFLITKKKIYNRNRIIVTFKTRDILDVSNVMLRLFQT